MRSLVRQVELFFLILPCLVVNAGTYYFFCDVSNEPLMRLQWNSATLEYELEEPTPPPTASPLNDQDTWNWRQKRRMGEALNDGSNKIWLHYKESPGMSPQVTTPAIALRNDDMVTSVRSLEQETNVQQQQQQQQQDVYARLCPCSENQAYLDNSFYCTAEKRYCAVPASYTAQGTQAPLCLNLQSDEIFARSVWPVVMIWFFLSVIFCVCTTAGRNALGYMLATMVPSYNERLIHRWLERYPGRAHDLWRRHWERERFLASGGQIGSNSTTGAWGWLPFAPVSARGNRKVEFVLATRTFQASEFPHFEPATTMEGDAEEEEEDDSRVTCSICFIPFEEGDRIGKLQCPHLFHVDCIKGWIERRNSCPLCREQLARPRHPQQEQPAVEGIVPAVE